MRRLTLLLIAAVALVLAACSGGDDPGASSSAASEAARTVTAALSDDMAIELSESDFRVGETVLFEVTNEGAIVHEFYLGDEEEQAHHADEMAEMGMSHDDPNGVAVEPGETETLEYTFGEAGAILAGCHEPGHYEAGMVASMSVAVP